MCEALTPFRQRSGGQGGGDQGFGGSGSSAHAHLALSQEVEIVDRVGLAVDLGARLGHAAMRLVDGKLRGRRPKGRIQAMQGAQAASEEAQQGKGT